MALFSHHRWRSSGDGTRCSGWGWMWQKKCGMCLPFWFAMAFSENMEDMQQETEKSSNLAGLSAEHQFSDAEESDGEDGDENDEDDEDEDDFDDTQGDSTPKTRSRSTSPQPPQFSSLSVNSAGASQGASPEGSLSVGHSSLISYLVTLPSIQVTQLVTSSDSCEDSQMTEYQRFFQSKSTDSEPDKDRLDIPSCMDEDCMLSLDPNSSPRDLSPSSQQSSPGYDSSPYRDNSPKRYLMPKGDLSPRRHLSPRRDISPMRHLSPRKEAVLRRELSPRRDVSPRRHLSPRRPMSPGKDASVRRDLSPRRERRYMASVRATSPRRGLYHNPALPMGQYLQSESIPVGHSVSMKEYLFLLSEMMFLLNLCILFWRTLPFCRKTKLWTWVGSPGVNARLLQ